MFSEQQIQIVADYVAAVTAYYAAIRELEARLITGSTEVYAKNLQATEQARAICEALGKNCSAPRPSRAVLLEPVGRGQLSGEGMSTLRCFARKPDCHVDSRRFTRL